MENLYVGNWFSLKNYKITAVILFWCMIKRLNEWKFGFTCRSCLLKALLLKVWRPVYFYGKKVQ